MKLMSVVGARPNFMKIAPFIRAIKDFNSENSNQIDHILVHTGQHYDIRMSKIFFDSLHIPEPEINLEIGSGSHAQQIGSTMIAFEDVLIREQPDWVILLGDVNATLACSIIAKKLHIKVCHIEAGLRSGDDQMPEEINRLVTDRLSDLMLTPDKLSSQNLRDEGVRDSQVKLVGNIMIDTLEANKARASQISIKEIIEKNLVDGQSNFFSYRIDEIFDSNSHSILGGFIVVTMHRPSNVDDRVVLESIIRFFLDEISNERMIVWPIHPRTQKLLKRYGLWEELLKNSNILLLYPLVYHDMLRLNMSAKIMITDSGGLQEECTVLGTPCLTLRWNTERPITLSKFGGVSVLVGNDIALLRNEYHRTLNLERTPVRPDLWDGRTAKRCLEAIINY